MQKAILEAAGDDVGHIKFLIGAPPDSRDQGSSHKARYSHFLASFPALLRSGLIGRRPAGPTSSLDVVIVTHSDFMGDVLRCGEIKGRPSYNQVRR